MKVRFNTTIDAQLLEAVKIVAVKQQMSVSQLIEDYFRTIVRRKPARKKNLLDMVDRLTPNEAIIRQSMEKSAFYEDQQEKYGF
ncbi:DUF6364 family protein [Niabella drilacis]|uniref:Uncharacterized protein n=1 Tax=Niabella drilacis (strain DSM 25811 / CCM 8410 / CCUG 62505 / LMG 26954 / E90) TaxID=1285928 RepID=A0A1G6XW56_NIADE|nr:DUF6364 family protein [Niabella drilacis]SDD81657.1 hypothetical protein SAMN04487894_11417 [Niabella drilacis]